MIMECADPGKTQLNTLLRFLNIIGENPGINLRKISRMTHLDYYTISKLKMMLIPSGFTKHQNSGIKESKLILTPSGHVLREYLNELIYEPIDIKKAVKTSEG